MKIAIVAATEFELEGLRDSLKNSPHNVTFHTHGVGMMLASYHIAKVTALQPDLIIQCGIAGSYSKDLSIGEVVVVHTECLGDTGAEDHNQLLDAFNLNLINKDTFPFDDGLLINKNATTIEKVKIVKGVTVNLSAGNEETIRKRREKYHPEIETMEGACLHYVCLLEKMPFMQFRGISNIVEPRNKSNWNIESALTNCHREIILYLQQLN